MPELAAELARRNKSQRDLAIETGVSPDYISRVIRGRDPLTESLRRAIIEALEPRTAEELFGESP